MDKKQKVNTVSPRLHIGHGHLPLLWLRLLATKLS